VGQAGLLSIAPTVPHGGDHQVIESWGRTLREPHHVVPVFWRTDSLSIPADQTALPFGLGRSYGDSCLNPGGALLSTRGLNRFLAFDPTEGILRCEAGVTLAEVISLVVPRGWFLPVTPGTKYVTLGGAIANDVHGKNHHRAGSFGCYVRKFELLRSDGARFVCSPDENVDWFRSAIGGLGLTGLITWVELALKRIASPFLEMESVRFGSLDEFFDLSRESDVQFEHTVAWIDALAGGRSLGRGHYLRANHATTEDETAAVSWQRRLSLPFDLPSATLNRFTLRALNTAYYYRQLRRVQRSLTSIDRFFYPLDWIAAWPRVYGRRGLFQYQCVVPLHDAEVVVRELLNRAACSRQGSFLAVLKRFGEKRSPGWLSFPRHGYTLALDFPNRGERTLRLLDDLDRVVVSAGGAVYPAKDARMSPATFRASFPNWCRLVPFVDPAFSSSFWRRVTSESRGSCA
jgi:FAD/FMN-containing dehydrogenase